MAWADSAEASPLMASQGAVVSYPVGGGFPAASAPEATVAEWKAATIPVPENDVVAGGAKPSGSGPGTAEEIAPEALQAAMADNTNSAMAGHVDYMAIGIPSELKISNPATPHWRGAVVSVLLWGAVGFVLYERFTFSPTPPPACDDGEAGCSGSPADFTTDVDNQLPTISLAVLGVMYLIYLCESFRSDSRKYIWNFKDVAGSEAYLGRMVDQAPDIAMTGEAYHYETHFRTITTRDSNGNTSTRTETYTVKVSRDRPSHRPARFVSASGAPPPAAPRSAGHGPPPRRHLAARPPAPNPSPAALPRPARAAGGDVPHDGVLRVLGLEGRERRLPRPLPAHPG